MDHPTNITCHHAWWQICFCKQFDWCVRARLKEGQQRPPTKLFIFYFWLMKDVYDNVKFNSAMCLVFECAYLAHISYTLLILSFICARLAV